MHERDYGARATAYEKQKALGKPHAARSALFELPPTARSGF